MRKGRKRRFNDFSDQIFENIWYKSGNNSTSGWNFWVFSTVLKSPWLGAKTRLRHRRRIPTGKGRKTLSVYWAEIAFGLLGFGLLSFGLLGFGLLSFGLLSFGLLSFVLLGFGLLDFGLLSFWSTNPSRALIGRHSATSSSKYQHPSYNTMFSSTMSRHDFSHEIRYMAISCTNCTSVYDFFARQLLHSW